VILLALVCAGRRAVYYTLVALDFPLMDRLDKTRLESVTGSASVKATTGWPARATSTTR
jgi:hypothetical protein